MMEVQDVPVGVNTRVRCTCGAIASIAGMWYEEGMNSSFWGHKGGKTAYYYCTAEECKNTCALVYDRGNGEMILSCPDETEIIETEVVAA